MAELQRLQVENNKTFSNPRSEKGQGTALDQAAVELKLSSEAFTRSFKLADQYKLGDDKGLELLKKLRDGTTKLYDTIEYKRTLPALSEVQDVTKSIIEFTIYGMELSNKHLSMGMRGHSVGGSDYKIPD